MRAKGLSWQEVWRKGAAPLLSDEGLCALREALRADDVRLVQGATTVPPPLKSTEDWPVEAACALSLPGWLGDGLDTVGEVEEYFGRMCYEIDQRMGKAGNCRWLIEWFDGAPRDEMRAALLAEVDAEVERRGA